jgi:MYXO-CTERM domain-containing protein
MRRLALACSFLGSLIAAGCGPSDGHGAAEDRISETQESIAFGTQDSVHTAVVALLAPSGGQSFTECSGSIVKIANGQAYVLTAAHCCKDGSPTVVVRAGDYTIGEQYLFGGTPPAMSNVYKVVAGSAYWDSAYNGYDHDFCMLKFAGASSSWPTLALPTSSNDGVANGVSLEHVGFGMTNSNPNNTNRNTGTDKVSSFDNTTISYQQGGASKIPGPCEGDSGGPALLPAGAAQAQQTIVGVTSFGTTTTCGASDTGTSSRVIAGIGTGKFITNYLNDTPSGTQAGQQGTDCNSCQQGAQTGACASQASACGNDPKCIQLSQCYGNCTTQSCYTSCETTAGTQAVNELNNYANCICNTACTTECATECGGSTSSSSSSSSGGTVSACGFQGDATCINCISGSCCNQAQACANDTTCVNCLSAQTTACNSNSAFINFATCLQNSCNAECLGGSSSSSSSTSSSGNTSTSSSTSSSGGVLTSSSTSSSGALTTSSGGAGGDGAGGAGGNGNNNQDSGCSVGSAGSDTGSAASLAGMLLGLAIAAGRRRRAS